MDWVLVTTQRLLSSDLAWWRWSSFVSSGIKVRNRRSRRWLLPSNASLTAQLLSTQLNVAMVYKFTLSLKQCEEAKPETAWKIIRENIAKTTCKIKLKTPQITMLFVSKDNKYPLRVICFCRVQNRHIYGELWSRWSRDDLLQRPKQKSRRSLRQNRKGTKKTPTASTSGLLAVSKQHNSTARHLHTWFSAGVSTETKFCSVEGHTKLRNSTESRSFLILNVKTFWGRTRQTVIFLIHLQSIEQLETEMLNGQKLQGPATAEEVNVSLKAQNQENRYLLS